MLATLIAHLTARLTDPRWTGIHAAEEIDALADLAGQIDSGSAIVMSWRERADPNSLITGFRQPVAVQFLTGIVLREQDQFLGGDRAAAFDAYKADIEAALAGAELPGFETPCELVGGESSPISRGVSIYVHTWETSRFLTGGP